MVLSDSKRRGRYDDSGGQDDRKTGTDTLLAEACTALADLFGQILTNSIDDLANVDLVAIVKQNIEQNQANFHQAIEKQQALRGRWGCAQARLSNDSEDEEVIPVFEDVIAKNLHRAELAIESMEHNIEVSLVMLRLLKDYKYRKDEAVRTTFYGSSATSSATTTF